MTQVVHEPYLLTRSFKSAAGRWTIVNPADSLQPTSRPRSAVAYQIYFSRNISSDDHDDQVGGWAPLRMSPTPVVKLRVRAVVLCVLVVISPLVRARAIHVEGCVIDPALDYPRFDPVGIKGVKRVQQSHRE